MPRDIKPPVMTSLTIYPTVATPGDTVWIHYTARDSSGINHALLRVAGALVGETEISIPEAYKDLEGSFYIRTPDDLPLGSTVLTTVVVTDVAGNKAALSGSFRLEDKRLPTVTMELIGVPRDTGASIRTGTTLEILVRAQDNHRLSYIGITGGGLRDSVRAAWTFESRTFVVTIPESWRMLRPVLSAWARDEAGNMSAETENNVREVPVFDWVEHPVQTTDLGNDGDPIQVLWDTRRSVVYVLYPSRIEVVSANGGARGTPIPLPAWPHSFAFTTSGDSLVVTLPDPRALGVIDLLRATRSTALVPLQFTDDTSELLGPFVRRPRAVQVSGSHVFVSLIHGLFAARLVDVNLATGTQAIRQDFLGSSDLAQYAAVFRLKDGRLLVSPDSPSSIPLEHFVYRPGNDSFTPTSRLRPATAAEFSAALSGHIMLGPNVYSPAFDSVAFVSTRDWKENYQLAASISPDGSSVYTSTFYGYQKVRASDGYVLEQVKLGTTPYLLMPLDDGSRLIAIAQLPGTNKGDWGVMMINLR